ncbi:GntR family transcriptional regulator [Actinomadura gamaensis]|uniref:GntR family transcriptional regulator n=1 Tax=Actinomadura gamaensis TaxID=1763541 RepID=A0ABV9U145_9ACTN
MTRSTVIDQVTDHIARQIASGQLEPGERLPSIRQLATEHGVNPSTIQFVLARLHAAGFVEPRHGVGVVVRDIQLYGGVETWSYLLRLSPHLPDLVLRSVQEILDTLRMFYDTTLTKIEADPRAYDPAPVRRALQRLQHLAARDDISPADTHKAVLQVLRTGLAAVNGSIALAVLNSLGAMLGEIPQILQALYADPAEHLWWWDQMITAWETADTRSARQALTLLDDFHTRALQRLDALLTAETPTGPPTSG